MQLNCPCCHAAFPIEVALQHQDGREVMAMLSGMHPEIAQPLVAYIGFFRPAKQQLGWGRALRLMREVIDIGAAQAVSSNVLAAGLVEAARTLDDKRQAPGWKPLGNHNYLKRCLESAQARHSAGQVVGPATSPVPATRVVTSKAGGAMLALEGMRR